MDVNITLLKEDELLEIQNLYRSVNVELGTNEIFLEGIIKSELNDFDKVMNSNSKCFVAAVEGKIVGMVIARANTCICSVNEEGKLIELERLAVVSHMRRLGIGRKLIETVAKESNAGPVRVPEGNSVVFEERHRIHLTMISGNSKAERFYEDTGFHKTLTEKRVSSRNGDKYTLIHYCR